MKIADQLPGLNFTRPEKNSDLSEQAGTRLHTLQAAMYNLDHAASVPGDTVTIPDTAYAVENPNGEAEAAGVI